MRRSILFLFLIVGLLACEEENVPVSPSANNATLNSVLTDPAGLRINEFIEDGANKTSLFNSFLFVFDANGNVTATNASAQISGSYLVFQDDGKTELMMTFPINGPLYELTDDWYFISANTNTLRFEDSGDVLQFEKQ
jgi:hypothetical protein